MSYGSGWIDQWNRVSRWRERVRRDRDEWQNTGLGTEHFLDELHATFQAIWHLKDWLHNDIHAVVTRKDVERWVNSRDSVPLVAADLAMEASTSICSTGVLAARTRAGRT